MSDALPPPLPDESTEAYSMLPMNRAILATQDPLVRMRVLRPLAFKEVHYVDGDVIECTKPTAEALGDSVEPAELV